MASASKAFQPEPSPTGVSGPDRRALIGSDTTTCQCWIPRHPDLIPWAPWPVGIRARQSCGHGCRAEPPDHGSVLASKVDNRLSARTTRIETLARRSRLQKDRRGGV